MHSFIRRLSSHISEIRGFKTLVLAAVFALVGGAFANAFFLPTGAEVHNTGQPRVAADSRGGVHIVSPMVAAQGAVYAYCSSACADDSDVQSVGFYTEEHGSVGNAMIAIGANDSVHLLLSTYDAVVYAVCAANCGQENQWESVVVHENDRDWDITGAAFALDAQGNPRFLMHAYQAYLGLFAPDPGTRMFACDADCLNAANWRNAVVSEQSWIHSTLLYDEWNNAHVATVIPFEDNDLVAYLRCSGDCLNDDDDTWPGLGLADAYSDLYISEIAPAVSMALTSYGDVRLAFLGDDEGQPFLVYFECDRDCADASGENWEGTMLLHGSDGTRFGDGISLALDQDDKPRLAYTSSSSVLVAHCSTDCAARYGQDDWGLVVAELSSDIPPDDIFLYHNCTVGMWFLRQPALVIGSSGLPIVAYRAEDISMGYTSPDPTRPACVTGVDMTVNRLAVLESY